MAILYFPYPRGRMTYPSGRIVVFLSGPDVLDEPEESMQFHLTYQGAVRPTQREPIAPQKEPLAAHKHSIRREFHHQLKRLWNTNKFLVNTRLPPSYVFSPPTDARARWGSDEAERPLVDMVADLYHENGYRFVPLVREDWDLLCSLRILFLRRDIPGSVIEAGDIDNRLKTVIDALRRPRHANELVGNESPRADEDPFFCLLEDDKQVTHLEVETDTLLDPVTDLDADAVKAKLVISVEIRPFHTTMFNLSFS